MKARTKRKLFWTFVALGLSVAAAAIAVPPFISLDRMAPAIEREVKRQTGIAIKINGPIRLSLLGRTAIGARDVQIPAYNGSVEAVSFSIPFRSILNINPAAISGTVVLDNPRLTIHSLSPPSIPGRIVFNNGSITFKDKTYKNINGVFRNNTFSGTIRTDEHKYTFKTDGNYFIITNPNVRLNMRGLLAKDASGNITATGSMSLETSNANRFFEFDVPKISGRVRFKSDFEWSIDNIMRFHNITGETRSGDFTGEISVTGGRKKINLVANNIDMDLSFLQKNPAFLLDSDIRFAGNGRFKIADRGFDNIRLSSVADNETITIRGLSASGDGMSVSARGRVRDMAAEDLEVVLQNASASKHCVLSGNRAAWSCSRWNYRSAEFSASGAVTVGADSFDLEFNSENYDPTGMAIGAQFSALRSILGRDKGTVRFRLADGLHGSAEFDNGNFSIAYQGHKNTTLGALPASMSGLPPLPAAFLNATGEMQSLRMADGNLSLSFKAPAWELSIDADGNFGWIGNLATLVRAYRPAADLQFLNPNSPVAVRGKFESPFISDLEISTIGGTFAGKFNGRSFDLHGELLDLDALISRNYIENYDSVKFVSAEPLTFPFMLNMSLALTADRVRFDGETYERFVYSLTPERQRMSVADSARGSLLMSMDRRGANSYNLLVQANNFEIRGPVLPLSSRLNIADTTLTARAALSTNGFTANDFWRNMAGEIDMSFEGGILMGFDFDRFYDNAANVTRMNAEFVLGNALSGGQSQLRSLHIAGHYENGNFTTTMPLSASTRHTEYTGDLQVRRGAPAAQLRILLRGTSPAPSPMSVSITHGGAREYSLGEIMRTFDPDFMREFTRMHPRF